MDFLANAPFNSLFLSVLSLGELRKGVALKRNSDPAAAKAIGAWVDGLEANFADRILGVGAAVAKLWGEWSAQRPRSVVDTLLAATAVSHELILVTRNISDVDDLPVLLLNPWTTEA